MKNKTLKHVDLRTPIGRADISAITGSTGRYRLLPFQFENKLIGKFISLFLASKIRCSITTVIVQMKVFPMDAF